MYTPLRARARYTAVSIGAHAQFRRNKRELSHVGERNIKKCVEHKATERRGRGGAEEEGGGAESREGRRRKRDRKAEGERDAAGIKGEADKEGREGGRSCV